MIFNSPFGQIIIFWVQRERRNLLDDFQIVGHFNQSERGSNRVMSKFQTYTEIWLELLNHPQHDSLQERHVRWTCLNKRMGSKGRLGTFPSCLCSHDDCRCVFGKADYWPSVAAEYDASVNARLENAREAGGEKRGRGSFAQCGERDEALSRRTCCDYLCLLISQRPEI